MADHSLFAMLRRLSPPAVADGLGAVSDADLLRRYSRERDAAAFELIVWRHGATVWGACRRSLSTLHDAEDAFQAVFMVLARKAGAVSSGACLGGWLHRVAVRIARRAQARLFKLANRERSNLALEDAVNDTHAEWSDLGPVVDQEIDRLPAKFRTAFVLCHLQGHSCDEAARRLGCPKGTILSRLARARDRLKIQLTRRGITLSSAAFASLASGTMVSAASVELTTQTVLMYGTELTARGTATTAAILSQEVLRAMSISQLKVVCCSVLMLLGIGAIGWRELTSSTGGPDGRSVYAADKETPPANPTSDLDKLQGVWNIVSVISNGRKDDDEMRMIFEKDTLKLEKISSNGGVRSARVTNEWKIKLDPTAKPKSIDINERDKAMPGIYELDGDNNLRICLREKSETRPARFEADSDSGAVLIVLKRETKPAPAAKKDRAKERLYSFEFKNIPWSMVIEWFSSVSGLAYGADRTPTGTFSFTPAIVDGKPKQYTLAQIVDILNERLKPKGYMLVLRKESFGIVSEEDQKAELAEELRVAIARAKAAEQEARAERDAAEKARQIEKEARREAEAARRISEDLRRKAEKDRDAARSEIDELKKEIQRLKDLQKK